MGLLTVLVAASAWVGISQAPRLVYFSAKPLGTVASARSLESIVRRTIDASSFTLHINSEVVVYQAPDRTETEAGSLLGSLLDSITIGSTNYFYASGSGTNRLWYKVHVASKTNALGGRASAMAYLVPLLQATTAEQLHNIFVVQEILSDVPGAVGQVLAQFVIRTNGRYVTSETFSAKGSLPFHGHNAIGGEGTTVRYSAVGSSPAISPPSARHLAPLPSGTCAQQTGGFGPCQ
jgi:hypothetical protein